MSNRFGGNKHKRYKKGTGIDKKEEIPFKDGTKIYATVIRLLGGSRVLVSCDDNIERQAIIPGSMYKRVWLRAGDVLLVQVEEIAQGNCYVVFKYNEQQIRKLRSENSLNFKNDGTGNNEILFGDDDQYDSEEEEDIFDQVEDEINKVPSSIPNKMNKKEKELKRINDRSKKNDVNINDVPIEELETREITLDDI